MRRPVACGGVRPGLLLGSTASESPRGTAPALPMSTDSLGAMARGGRQGQGEPVDWVTRAADDAVRHAGEGNLVTVASGASPSGPIHLGNLREFITPHFVAEELRRRGVPVRHLHSWDDFDRFRKVPAGVPAEWADHIGRPLTAVPDPWECHAELGRALQGAAAGLAARARRGDGGDLPDRDVHLRRLPRAGPRGRGAPRRHRGGAGQAPHQEGQCRRGRLRAGGRRPRRLGRQRGRRRGDLLRRLRSPASPTAPTAASAGATPSPRRRTTRPPRRCPTPAPPAATTARPTCRATTTASSCGRSTGRCAGPTRRSTSSRPVATT